MQPKGNNSSTAGTLMKIHAHNHIMVRYFPYKFQEIPFITLENHCTGTTQSSGGGCSRRVHKILYLAFKKGTILVIFTSENIHRESLSLKNPAAYLLNRKFVN